MNKENGLGTHIKWHLEWCIDSDEWIFSHHFDNLYDALAKLKACMDSAMKDDLEKRLEWRLIEVEVTTRLVSYDKPIGSTK